MESKADKGNLSSLSLELDPGRLLVSYSKSSDDPSKTPLDAIFIPTRGRSEYVSQLVQELQNSSANIFVLPTSENDHELSDQERSLNVQHLLVRDQAFLDALRKLQCTSNRLSLGAEFSWDLPTKRNYALWYVRRNKLGKILLLDDDIRGITSSILSAGAAALDRFPACGLFVEDFPDTSVVGHINIAVGDGEWAFISGNSLFLRADVDLGFFPPIYNEDWIFLAPHLIQRQVAVIGNIKQEPYDPFIDSKLAGFQEAGEVIGEGLFALMDADSYDRRFDRLMWREVLKLRREWLSALLQMPLRRREQDSVTMALRRCEEITEGDCVQFIEDWEGDCVLWNSLLRECS